MTVIPETAAGSEAVPADAGGGAGAGGGGGRPRSLLRGVLRRPLAVASLGYLLLVAVAAVTAPWLAPYDPTATDLAHVLSGPTREHWLGTDQLGRDLLSRLMHGGQVSLVGAVQAVATVLVLGVPLGLVAGFAGGWVDRVVSRVIDVALAVPVIVILLVVLAVFGNDQTVAMVAVGVLGAPDLARVVRGATLAVRGELYVTAARVAGLPAYDIMARQVLPKVTGPIVVRTSLFAGGALLAQSGLSFLGLGVQPPEPTWGGMVAEASTVISLQPWLLVPSGAMLGLAILAFGLIGDAVRDASADRTSTPSARLERTPAPAAEAAMPQGADGDDDQPRAALLSLRGLRVELPSQAGPVRVIEGLDLDLAPGETVGLLGESGCGKSMTGRAILGLLPGGGAVTAGSIRFDGTELTQLDRRSYHRLRGAKIAVVSQEPMASLDPVFRVGAQLAELVRRHDGGSRRSVRARVLELLDGVNLPDPEAVARRYPHELSGGMAQRVAISMALAGRPRLLIADEPTTALDVTVQAEILDLLRRLQQDTGLAILMITHDWGVVADSCTRAYVMYAGQVVEAAPVTELFARPLHPYTAALLASMPHQTRPGEPLPAIPGTVPAPGSWPTGCRFQDRCPLAVPACATAPVPVLPAGHEHGTRCLRHTAVRPEPEEERDHAESVARRS